MCRLMHCQIVYRHNWQFLLDKGQKIKISDVLGSTIASSDGHRYFELET